MDRRGQQHRARSKYDQHASRTSWITYDMTLTCTADG